MVTPHKSYGRVKFLTPFKLLTHKQKSKHTHTHTHTHTHPQAQDARNEDAKLYRKAAFFCNGLTFVYIVALFAGGFAGTFVMLILLFVK